MSKETLFRFGTTMSAEDIEARLAAYEQHTAQEIRVPMYRHRLPGWLVSDGVFMLSHECDLWAIIDHVIENQITKRLRSEPMQIWTIKPGSGRYGTEYWADDPDGHQIHWAGKFAPRLPIPELRLFVVGQALMLPCEYMNTSTPAAQPVSQPAAAA